MDEYRELTRQDKAPSPNEQPSGPKEHRFDFKDPEVTRYYLKEFLENSEVSEMAAFSYNVCEIFQESPLSPGEREEAEALLRDLAHSVELGVREVLAMQLKTSKILPNDIAVELANDVESVALPILEYSEVLSDKDLVDIIRAKGSAQQCAVARRKSVSNEVCREIVQRALPEPVETMLKNEGAEVSEESYENVVVLFPAHDAIKEAMVRRPDLPIDVAGKLVAHVAEHLQFELIARHSNSSKLIERLISQGNEGSLVSLLAQYEDIQDAEIVAGQLFKAGRLTPTILVRALYFGQIDFLEFAISRMSQVTLWEVRRLLLQPRSASFQLLYRRAGMPAQFFAAFREALLHLHDQIVALEVQEDDSNTRRQVPALVRHPDFDIPEFEATLLMTEAG